MEDLKEQGLLVKVVPHSHNVGVHDRCHTTVEPMIKQQWFVKMDEMIKPAVEGVKNGEIKLLPSRMDKKMRKEIKHLTALLGAISLVVPFGTQMATGAETNYFVLFVVY